MILGSFLRNLAGRFSTLLGELASVLLSLPGQIPHGLIIVFFFFLNQKHFDARLVLMDSMCAKKTFPIPLHHHYQPAMLTLGKLGAWIHFWPYHLYITAEIDIQQARWHIFFNLHLFSFDEPMHTVALESCSWQTWDAFWITTAVKSSYLSIL